MPATLDTIRRLCADLAGVEEGPSYGTPGFRVRKKLFARMHQSEDAVVLRVGFEERDRLLETRPGTFYVTDHYADHPWVLARMKRVEVAELRGCLRRAWEEAAPRGLREALENAERDP